jgi:Spy/CpxP family protein refolding chaperone
VGATEGIGLYDRRFINIVNYRQRAGGNIRKEIFSSPCQEGKESDDLSFRVELGSVGKRETMNLGIFSYPVREVRILVKSQQFFLLFRDTSNPIGLSSGDTVAFPLHLCLDQGGGRVMVRFSVVFGLGILMLALLVGGAETQQGTKKDPGKAKGQLPQGWKNLNLSPTQIEQIYTIQTDYKEKRAELAKQAKELTAKEKAELVKILTPEQRTKLIEITTGDKTEEKKTTTKTETKTEAKKSEEKK